MLGMNTQRNPKTTSIYGLRTSSNTNSVTRLMRDGPRRAASRQTETELQTCNAFATQEQDP